MYRNVLTVIMCNNDNDIDLTYCNDQYDYQFMRLAEDLFLLSVAHGAPPPFFFDHIAQKVPYHVNYL